MTIQPAPPELITPRPPSVYTTTDEGVLEDKATVVPATVLPTEREFILRPEPQPVAVPQAVVPQETFAPWLNLLCAQQSQIASTQTAEQKRQRQQVDVDAERNRVVQEQEERIRALEAELVHTREELEEERGTCRMEDLERADRERAENNE